MSVLLDEYFNEYSDIISSIDYGELLKAAELLGLSEMIFFAGNGGSQASASHMAGDLSINTPLNVPIIALGDNATTFSATANDWNYESVFAREFNLKYSPYMSATLVVISTSGKSKNVIECAKAAFDKGIDVIAMTGSHTETLAKYSSVVISVDSLDAGFVEAAHDFIGHVLVRLLKAVSQHDTI